LGPVEQTYEILSAQRAIKIEFMDLYNHLVPDVGQLEDQ